MIPLPTANTLKAAGFRISAQVKDEQVAKAANEVLDAYIRKVANIGEDVHQFSGPVVDAALKQLTWILLCRRDTVVTRAGAKDKLAPSLSDNATVRQCDLEEADIQLRNVQALPEGIAGNIPQLVDDIAHIYYRNEFLGL